MISLGISFSKELFLIGLFVKDWQNLICSNIYSHNFSITGIFTVDPDMLKFVHQPLNRLCTILLPSDKRWAKTNWCKLILISRNESVGERRMARGFCGREEEFDCTDGAAEAVRRALSTFTCKVHVRSKATYRSIVSSAASWTAAAARRTVIASTLCFLLLGPDEPTNDAILDDDAVPRVV